MGFNKKVDPFKFKLATTYCIIYNPVQKFLENAFFRSYSAICELFFPPSPISMLKIVIFVLHKVVLSR